MQGKVYLVGAGPAGEAYLTVRGQQLLREAEVVIYDDLVDQGLLSLVPTSAARIYVGKRAGRDGTSQAEIDRLLVERSNAGQQVVRLKSGDPFVFGRATSELEALALAGCPFEVVPGVSSAIAAPLFAGIPLTDREWGRHFCVLSAHALETLPWQALAAIDTLVVLMGAGRLAEVTRRLIEAGRPESLPVAWIEAAGRPQQQVTVGTLQDIAARVEPTGQPTVIVIGPVVHRRDRFGWFGGGPLAGRRILVTRALDQASSFATQLGALGATVIEMPALVLGPPTSYEALDRAISRLGAYQWLVLTSTNGVDAFFERLAHHRLDPRALGGVKLAVVGPKTARAVHLRGLLPDFVPDEAFVAEGLLESFPDREGLAGKEVLFVRVESGGRETITGQLRAWGARVDEVAGYATTCPEAAEAASLEALRTGQVDCVSFASAKTVRHFARMLRHEDLKGLLETPRIASIGPQTSAACREVLGRVDIEARVYTLDGLTRAIAAEFAPAAEVGRSPGG